MCSIQDTPLVWRGFNFDTGPVLFKGRFFPTSDAKPARGMLGPTFMGMVMRWDLVVGGPIMPVAKGLAARRRRCLVMEVLDVVVSSKGAR
jgi:hypothetical protein